MKTQSRSSIISALLALSSLTATNGFVTTNPTHVPSSITSRTDNASFRLFAEEPPQEAGRPDFEFSFEIPKKGIADVGTAEVKLPPILENSQVVVVRYELPFGLSAEPCKESGQVVVTKDGKADGGERVGDVLRQTTYWRGKTPGLFDVSKNADNFDLVVQALVTNDLSVADDIVLVFERPL